VFVILRTGNSSSVALHLPSQERSYCRLMSPNQTHEGTYTLPFRRRQRRTSHHRQMVDGLVRTLGSGVFAVATIFPVGDFRRLSLIVVTASKGMRPAHTPYKNRFGKDSLGSHHRQMMDLLGGTICEELHRVAAVATKKWWLSFLSCQHLGCIRTWASRAVLAWFLAHEVRTSGR